MYLKTFMCTTTIQITYRRDNPSHLLRYFKNYYKKKLSIYKIYRPILTLSLEDFKKTPHWCFLHKNLSFLL